MKNYELVFSSVCTGGGDLTHTELTYRRIVVADSEAMAQEIAGAMLGEEVGSSEYLCRPVSVKETVDPPQLHAWSPDKAWERVLRRIKNGLFCQPVLVDGKTVGIRRFPVMILNGGC